MWSCCGVSWVRVLGSRFLTRSPVARSYARARASHGAAPRRSKVSVAVSVRPKRCSDLAVCRYNARSLASELGVGFSLVREAGETHATPWGSSQAFVYGVFRRL